MDIPVILDENEFNCKIIKGDSGHYIFEIDEKEYHAILKSMESGKIDLVVNGHALVFYISDDDKGYGTVTLNGHNFQIQRKDILVQEDVFGALDAGGKDGGEIVSPMPGKVIKINVKEGKEVKKGDILLVVEAMKMENSISSQKDGTVETIKVKEGDMVDGSTELVLLRE